jgi:hypothetical protein
MYHDYDAPGRVSAIPSVQAMVAAAGPLPAGGYGSWDHPTVPFVSLGGSGSVAGYFVLRATHARAPVVRRLSPPSPSPLPPFPTLRPRSTARPRGRARSAATS